MATNILITGGTHNHAQNICSVTSNSAALKALTDAASPSAFHNSGMRHDPPKCHENTRVAVLGKLKGWASGADSDTRNKWIMWMYGGAGAGKSAIGQTFAEKCDSEGRLLASFFFGRSDATRNQASFLVPTIACQVYKRVSEARDNILAAIDNDPMIFNSTLLIQFESLVIHPLMELQDISTPNVIIIDGLDECVDRSSQSSILRALFDVVQRLNCRIRFLVASRPEHDIVTAFSLQADAVFARLMLDDKYKPAKDIRLFLNDRIRLIKETHPFRYLIPPEWPEKKAVDDIVEKSSRQFIYVSTAVKFIESIRHLPHERMDVVRNLRPPNGAMPFVELDALYTHILTSGEHVSMIVELLSFILYVSKHYIDVTMACLEELHDLVTGSVELILCDVGALVVIDEDDHVKVLHASLLDFLIDPSRSKDLPISGDVLITKHITTCFRYLSKNKISGSRDRRVIDDTLIALQFLEEYFDCIPVFTADMAEALDGFSLLKLCQADEIPIWVKHSFLKCVNLLILQLLRQSDQHEFLSRYLTMMDKSFLALMDTYPPHSLALQISIMKHDDVFPFSALHLAFQLPKFCEQDDKLGILRFYDSSEDLGLTKAQRNLLLEFLLDPSRSQHHDFLRSWPKLYVMTLLGCFDYLSKVIIEQDCSIEETWLASQAISVTLSEDMMLENQGGQATPQNDCDEMILNSSNEYSYTNTENTQDDIKAWQQGYEDDVEMVHGAQFEDLDTVDRLYEKEFPRIMRGRYYFMLGYMIYFFPLAGFSPELIELCKNTVLHRHPKLFPEQTAAAQRAMGAYPRRMAANSADSIETNTLQGSHSNILNDPTQSNSITAPAGPVNQDDATLSTSRSRGTKKKKKKVVESHSVSTQSVPADNRHVRASAKCGPEFIDGSSTATREKRTNDERPATLAAEFEIFGYFRSASKDALAAPT